MMISGNYIIMILLDDYKQLNYKHLKIIINGK